MLCWKISVLQQWGSSCLQQGKEEGAWRSGAQAWAVGRMWGGWEHGCLCTILPPFSSRRRLKDKWQLWWQGRDLPTNWTEPPLSTTAFDQCCSYLARGRDQSAWHRDGQQIQDLSGKCRKGPQTSYYWMLAIWLCCFCSSSVGMVNEKVVKGSEFPEYLTISAFLDLCRSGYRQSTAQRLHCTGSPGYRWISGLQDVIVRSISCLWCPEVLLSCFWSSARIDGTMLCSLFP